MIRDKRFAASVLALTCALLTLTGCDHAWHPKMWNWRKAQVWDSQVVPASTEKSAADWKWKVSPDWNFKNFFNKDRLKGGLSSEARAIESRLNVE